MSKRIQGVDNLRGLAALMVCLKHVPIYNFPNGTSYFQAVLLSLTHYGWLGVEIFFVISGFIIPYSLHRGGYRVANYGRFIAKRFLRLDPPYIVSLTLILAFGFLQATASGETFEIDVIGLVLHLGYLNVFFGHPWLSLVYWTLAIELQYYLLVGLVYPLIVSDKRLARHSVFLACGLLWFLLDRTFTPGTEAPMPRFIFHVLPLFCMGIATFQFRQAIIRKAEFLILIGIFTVAGCVIDGWLSILAGLVAVLGIIAWNYRNPVLDFLGDISYSLYLIHWPIAQFIISVTTAKLFGLSDGGKAAAICLAFIASIVSAYLLYSVVEKPAQKWSSSIRYID